MINLRCRECGEHKMSTMNMTTKFESHGICIAQKKTTPTDNKLWDGYLQLNSALTVSTVALYESGEKMPDVKWSESVVVKGKVKLHDFEKYIQELPRSRNKGFMVVSLYWKKGSSKLGLEGMKKIAKKYVEDGRVGVAKVITGIDLYVCPPSDTIITILEKYGYFSGRTTFEENMDSLIGCVVWRRNQINLLNSVHQKSSISSRKNDHIQVWSPIRTPSEWSTKKDPIVWSPIRSPSEWSRKNDHIVWSPIHTSYESSRKNDHIVWSPIHVPSGSSRKNDPIVWSPIRKPSESSRKHDSSPVWSPIHWPLESSTKNDQVRDITKKRDKIERDKNGSKNTQPHQNFRIHYYSVLTKSEDTPIILNDVSAEVEKSNIDSISKDVRPVLVSDVTVVTKQSLSSAILQKELEDDLPEFDFGTLTTCCQPSHKRRLEQDMEQDMDISPPESPHKKVCSRHENDNMSRNITRFAVAPPKSPFNAFWFPSVPYVKQLNAEVTHQASNKPQFTNFGPVLNSVQQNFIPPPSSFQINPPFPTQNPNFTYLGPTFIREHAHPHVHENLRRNYARIAKVPREHVATFNQHYTSRTQKAANQQYQSNGQ